MDSRFATKLLPLALLVAVACGSGPSAVAIDQEFTLAPGQTVDVAGTDLHLTFRQVRDDSRCPSDAVCVWAGNAAVELAIRRNADVTTAVVNTLLAPRAVPSDPYVIELLALTPVPLTSDPPKPDEYRARLRVSDPDS